MGKLVAAALAFAGAAGSSQSWAATIVAPVTASATTTFPSSKHNDYSIENTIDQSGLSLPYVSGLTDLDSYLAIKPNHTSNANGNEWFSQDLNKTGHKLSPKNAHKNLQSGKASQKHSSKNGHQNLQSGKASHKLGASKVTRSHAAHKNQQTSHAGSTFSHLASKVSKKNKVPQNNTSSANSNFSTISSAPLVSITYGFSRPLAIDGFILWNEEFAGIGTTELLSSIDGITYTLLSTITPKPSKFALPGGDVVPYLAQVFSFDLTTMLFFRLLIYDCPKPSANHESYRGCGIGEVAFSSSPRPPSNIPPVPVPAALPLLGAALGIFAWLGRRQKKLN